MALVVFAVFAVIGQVLNVMFCLALDKIFSPTVGGLAFVLLYMLVFAGAWLLTLKAVDRDRRRRAVQPRYLEPAPSRIASLKHDGFRLNSPLVPAEAGTQRFGQRLGSRFRGSERSLLQRNAIML